ncbi:MAG: protein BatD [Paludibacteraceae bacterium]|nr:protein BatD [Paludibacteraceae bacterium]
MRRTTTIFLLALCAMTALADEVSFKASAPGQVIAGQPFQLTYSVNQRSKDLRAPEMADFDILAGPYTSQSSSTSWVNGQRTSSFSQTYTYTLVALKEGTFTIQPATITVSGTQYTSNGLKIKVLPPDETPAAESEQPAAAAQRQQQQASGAQAGGDNIFIRTVVSKTNVHEQECILLQYKLYFAGVDVTQFTNNTKLPEFKGFLKQELEQGEIQTQLEHYNGRNYNTAVLYQTLLYPQHSGDLKIDPAQFEAVLRVQTRAQVRSIFDDFFGSYTNVTRALTAPGMTIHAAALPKGKPAGFSGGVGRFSLKSNISTQEVTQNEAVTLKLDISGSGNLKLLKTPAVDFPEGFEEYDPKVSNNFKNTTAGMSGTKSIEYLFIPRAAGDYTIPAVSFSYFDTQDKQYKTLTTPEYTLHVKRGAGEEQTAVVSNYVNKEDIRQLGTDIRYISPEMHIRKDAVICFGSLLFWLCYLLPLLAAAVLFIIFRRQIRENADLRRVRYKKAGKVAQKRLKQAKRLMDEGKRDAFYEEIERAAWNYLSDRLSIPTAELNKENINQLLTAKGVSEELTQRVNDLLSTAEFARYAPTRSEHDMEELYDKTAAVFEDLKI